MPDSLTTPGDPLTAATASAPPPEGRGLDDQTLRHLLATAVLAADGVTRIEPTLKSLLGRIAANRHRLGPPTAQPPADGIIVTTRGSVTDLTIDIATHQQALRTAATVQRAAHALLTAHDREPGLITINVLSIDQPRT